MRVQDDEELAAEEGRQVRDVVARAESDAKAACLGPRLGVCLAAGTHVLDGLEVGVGEDGVIVGEQRWSLELGRAWEREAACVVRAQVENDLERAGAGVVSILRHLLEQRSFWVVHQHIPQPHAQIHLLPEVGPGIVRVVVGHERHAVPRQLLLAIQRSLRCRKMGWGRRDVGRIRFAVGVAGCGHSPLSEGKDQHEHA